MNVQKPSICSVKCGDPFSADGGQRPAIAASTAHRQRGCFRMSDAETRVLTRPGVSIWKSVRKRGRAESEKRTSRSVDVSGVSHAHQNETRYEINQIGWRSAGARSGCLRGAARDANLTPSPFPLGKGNRKKQSSLYFLSLTLGKRNWKKECFCFPLTKGRRQRISSAGFPHFDQRESTPGTPLAGGAPSAWNAVAL